MLLLLLYFIFIIFYLFGVFAVLYHLKVYSLNSSFTAMIIFIFLTGSITLLVVNLLMAMQIDWHNIQIII